MPNSTFIFSLNEIATIQSLDVVAHQRRMEAKFAEEMAKEPSTKPVVNSKAKEDQKNDTSKTV